MSDINKRPVAVCGDCITYSFNSEDIGQACRVKRGSYSCSGKYIDAVTPENWKICTACSGTGIDFMGESCVACQASGWLLIRRRT